MISSVTKALDILQLFTTAEPRLPLSEISRRLGIPKSTVHHLIATLAQQNFIEQTDDGSYALGKKIIALTQNVQVNVELRDRAAPLLRALADASRESVYLTVRDGDAVLYIYAIESSQRLMARTAVGDHAPLYCTSVGKAIIAYLPPEEIDRMYPTEPLHAHTGFTQTTLKMLKEDLEVTRMRGYALDRQEHELETYCIGAPIFNQHGTPIGACSISGRDYRIVSERMFELGAEVTRVAGEISRRMGYVPARPSQVRRGMKG